MKTNFRSQNCVQKQKTNLTKIKLARFRSQLNKIRIKLRYIRYPLALIRTFVPQNSSYALAIKFSLTILRTIRYSIYLTIGLVVIYSKLTVKD
jgi:hypothetical protein